VHTLHVTDPEQFDAEVRGWFLESYRLMGMRERLQQTAARQVRTRR
jgi:hypothetical protein